MLFTLSTHRFFYHQKFLGMFFVHDHSIDKTKLNMRDLKRVFLGYSSSKKGYRTWFETSVVSDTNQTIRIGIGQDRDGIGW